MFSSAPPIPNDASRIRELADAITTKRNEPLPDWNLAQFSGISLQCVVWLVHCN